MSFVLNQEPAAAGGLTCEPSPVPPADDSICRACARIGHTCCQAHDIYVTLGDCRRIAQAFPHVDFIEYRLSQNPAYQDQEDDPLWAQYVFHKDGTRRVLRRKANEDCMFLTDTGCGLALTVRPLVCRLFPHQYTAAGISGQWDSECAMAQSRPADQVLAGIAGVIRQEAENWHHMLYREIMWEIRSHEDWINL